jgi:hypothetical protein
MSTPTTRRYPRSTMQAWPDRYPGSIAHYRRPLRQRVADALLTSTIAVGLAAVLFYSLSA